MAVYKRPLKEEEGLFTFGFYLGLLPLAFCSGLLAFALECEAFPLGFCLLLLAFWYGKLLEGKRLLKEKGLLKGNC
jgi:hypothetical protein